MRISVHGEKPGGFRLPRKESSFGNWRGREERLKNGLFGCERSFPVLTARRWVDVAKPPSETSCVMNWEYEFRLEG